MGCQAQSTSIGVVSVHERSVWARSVLFITKAIMATAEGRTRPFNGRHVN